MSDQMDPDQCRVNKDFSHTEPEPPNASFETVRGLPQSRYWLRRGVCPYRGLQGLLPSEGTRHLEGGPRLSRIGLPLEP